MSETSVELLSDFDYDSEDIGWSDDDYDETPGFEPVTELPPKPSAKKISAFFMIVDRETGEPKKLNADGSGAADFCLLSLILFCVQLRRSVGENQAASS